MKRRQFAILATHGAVLALAGCSKGESVAATPVVAATKPPSPREAYELASTGNGFSVGPVMAAHVAYVFFDTTCPHCAQLWLAAKPLQGKLKMVWMPVGVLRQQSAPQGATILSAPNPAEAMAQNEASVLERKGGISVASTLPEEALGKVKANTDLFSRLAADSVPLIVFKNAKTGEYGLRAGSVDTAELAALVGV